MRRRRTSAAGTKGDRALQPRWLALSLLGCAVVQAQTGPPGEGDGERRTERSQRVDIVGSSASDTELRRRAPVARAVYGREELDKYADTNLGDVLKRLPGINVQGGAVRMRGLGAGYTQVLVNGEPAPPNFSMDNLSPSQVERIEVTKAPTADTSAQAVAGTINIVLKEPPRRTQRELRLGLGYLADYPTGWFNATWGDRIGALGLVLPLSAFQWRNHIGNTTERETRDVAGAPQSLRVDGHDTHFGGGLNFSPRLNWRFDEATTLSSQSFLQHGRFNSRSRYDTEVVSGSAPVSVDDRTRNEGLWENLRSNLTWQRRFESDLRLELRGGLQRSRNESDTVLDGFDARGVQTLLRDTVANSREHGVTSGAKWVWPQGERHMLTGGWDFEARRREEVRSVTENGHEQLAGFDGQSFRSRILRQALFAQDEWEIAPQWSTVLGLRTERIGTTSSGAGADTRNDSRVVSPLAHLTYKLDPKGRDLVRASLARTYRAPTLSQMLGRPSLNALYPPDRPNPQIGPDRIGNPQLKPELATGLDLAVEKYLDGGGLVSAALFHRRIEGLIRNAVTLETVPWASVPRWVSRPVNLKGATTQGVELELKGRAGELMPSLFSPQTALSLRGALNLYRSSVDDIPGPDNRLESQPPYSANLGFDWTVRGLPLAIGASLAWTPGYAVQQTLDQWQDSGRVRTLDAYAQWTFGPAASLRLAVNNVAPLGVQTVTRLVDALGVPESNATVRHNRSWINLALTTRF